MSAQETRRAMSLLFVGLVAALVLGYGAFEGRKILAGPELFVASPTEGSATSTSLVTIAGMAQNIAFLSINNAQAYTDARGQFRETLSVAPGYTTVTITATDRFLRTVTRTVHFTVVSYCPLS